MSLVLLPILALFIPLFPFSMVFNALFQRLQSSRARLAILLIWPQLGVFLANAADLEVPAWVILWALFTALLYAYRALALREVGLWTAFMATSAWTLLWVTWDPNQGWLRPVLYSLAFSAPLALLVLLSRELEKRFGAAYTGLYTGLAISLPRLSGTLVVVVLAIIGTPLFPAFSVMVSTIVDATSGSFATAVSVSAVWLLWGWAGARLLQGLIVGPPPDEPVSDLALVSVWAYASVLVILVIMGISMTGGVP